MNPLSPSLLTIYQVLPRLFGNDNTTRHANGSIKENGCGHLADFTQKALEKIRELGATHIWYTGIIEHATQTSYAGYGIQEDYPSIVKGRAGSPYAIKDYYDIDPDLATDVTRRVREFENLVARTHRAGLGVIMDFVPNHVARQYCSDACPPEAQDLGSGDDTSQAFSPHNNFYYIPGEELHAQFDLQGYREMPARATGNDVFHAWPSQTDWYETVKLNYGIDYVGGHTSHFQPIPETWHKMLHILLFWARKGVDAFRCDMAEMVPVEFWQWVIPSVKAEFPHLFFIAEVYNPALYREYIHRGGFDYLYDKVGFYDTLRAVVRGEASAQSLTACWQQVDDIRRHMLYFLENHDEQRLASDFFAGDARKGRAALLVAALMSTNPFMLYFGQELGERGMDEEGFSGRDGRTTIFDYWCVDSIRRWRNHGRFDGTLLTDEERALQAYYCRVLTLRLQNETLREGDFYDLMYVNPHLHSQYVFVRRLSRNCVTAFANFSDRTEEVQVNLPHHLFELYGLTPQQDVEATDLLSGESLSVSFTPNKPLCVSLPAWGGLILQIKN